MNILNLRIVSGLSALLLAVALAGCGASAGGSTTTPTTPVTTTATHIALATTLSQVKSDNSTSATVTATVLDSGNAVVSGAPVTFSATSGQLSVGSGTTPTNGQIQTAFSSGSNAANRTSTLTATVTGTTISAQIPIQVIGSSLTVTPSSTSLSAGGSVTLAITAKDASGTGVSGQSLQFAINSSSTGAGTLSAASATTTTGGSAPTLTFNATAAGTVGIDVTWVDASGAVTLTSSTALTVTGSGGGGAFAVTTPASDPTVVITGATQSLVVSVPATIGGVSVAHVRVATSIGTWTSSGTSVATLTPSGGTVTDLFQAGSQAGSANIQIDALNGSGTAISGGTLNRTFSLSPSVASASAISLQANVSNIPPSTGSNLSKATLTATVRDGSNPPNPVANVPVLFQLVNPTGSGEQLSPVVTNTIGDGTANSTFTAGSLSTQGGLTIRASVVGTPAIRSDFVMNVTGSATSVTLGQATKMSSTDNNTTYTLPMSVLVVDGTGSAVPNATVTLKAFPTRFWTGIRGDATYGGTTHHCQAVSGTVEPYQSYRNNDANENDVLDLTPLPSEDIYSTGAIEPPHASAGALPQSVVTNAYGVGAFNLVYLKDYADWVTTRIRASVKVNGSESTSEVTFQLAHLVEDETPCVLSSSPFNSFAPWVHFPTGN